jgi:hypothetical protein
MIANNVRATGDNRQNSSGNFAAVGPLGRTSIIYPVVVPADSVAPVPCAGTTFYVTVCTAAVDIRPIGGVFNTYTNGKGLKLKQENAFPSLEIKNKNAFPVVVQLFVGFDEFIDNALILANTGQTLVARPTYPTPSSASNVNINDVSGGAFTDINGVEWFALQREAIYIGNLDSGVTLLLQQFGSVVANGPAVMPIFPTTSLRYAASGNYCLNVGGGTINAIVSELYQAIPAQSQ